MNFLQMECGIFLRNDYHLLAEVKFFLKIVHFSVGKAYTMVLILSFMIPFKFKNISPHYKTYMW